MSQFFTLALTSVRVHPSNSLFVFVPKERLFLVFMSPSSSRATLTELMVPTSGKGRLCVCTLKTIKNLQRSNGFVLQMNTYVSDGWHIVSATIWPFVVWLRKLLHCNWLRAGQLIVYWYLHCSSQFSQSCPLLQQQLRSNGNSNNISTNNNDNLLATLVFIAI